MPPVRSPKKPTIIRGFVIDCVISALYDTALLILRLNTVLFALIMSAEATSQLHVAKLQQGFKLRNCSSEQRNAATPVALAQHLFCKYTRHDTVCFRVTTGPVRKNNHNVYGSTICWRAWLIQRVRHLLEVALLCATTHVKAPLN